MGVNNMNHTQPTVLIIFGAGGDLTWRKLAPALYNLLLDKQLPERFAVIGLDMKEETLEGFNQRLRDGAPKQLGAAAAPNR